MYRNFYSTTFMKFGCFRELGSWDGRILSGEPERTKSYIPYSTYYSVYIHAVVSSYNNNFGRTKNTAIADYTRLAARTFNNSSLLIVCKYFFPASFSRRREKMTTNRVYFSGQYSDNLPRRSSVYCVKFEYMQLP